jgi:hypothetical protein
MSNNKSYSTNRFLSKTNPQFIRGLADSGSVLDSPEINKLAAQMVDLGIWDDLKLWVHEGLVKERVSGTDVFVENAYDISGNNNDFANTDTTHQPKLITGIMDFDGTNHFLGTSNNSINTSFCTVCNWLNADVINQNVHLFNKRNQFISTVLLFLNGNTSVLQFRLRLTGSESTARILDSNFTISANTYYHLCGTYDGSIMRIYVNGVQQNTNIISGTISTDNYILSTIGRSPAGGSYFDGEISDVRYFDTALTATQIDAIFQATRGKYGV